jgi:hypothetical protein
MKVIFLDNDGVMCLSTEWGGRFKKMKKWHLKNPGTKDLMVNDKSIPVIVRMDNFNVKAVKVLNQILEETDAEIVVSSDWKLHCTLEELKDLFIEYGISKSPIDVTPNLTHHMISEGYHRSEIEEFRIAEIKKWLSEHPEVTHWVAVDDLNLSDLGNFVLTPKSSQGIKQCGIKEKILKLLC